MCGLFGMIGFLEHKHKDALKEMMFLSALRGKDSTGLSCVSRDKQVITRKMTVPSYEFLEYPVVERSMKFADQLWMGHTRWKTTGAVSKSNAHPFEIVDEDDEVLLVGTHNGTLQNKWEIEGKLKGERFDTDSEALFNWLVEAKDYKTAIKTLKGAWSLVWWDPTADAVHFCRNNERPLCFAFTEDRKVLVYASEAWMIINACRRNGVPLEKNDKGLSCYSTLVDNLYTIKIPQERNVSLPEMTREGGYTGAPVKNFQTNWNRIWGNELEHDPAWWNDDEEGKKETTSGGEKEKTDRETGKNVVTLGYPPNHENYKGFNGQMLSEKEFKAIRAKGCVWCKDKIKEGVLFGFLSEEEMVCVHCLRDTHPKGSCIVANDALDDDVPFDLTDKGVDLLSSTASPEARRILTAAKVKAK